MHLRHFLVIGLAAVASVAFAANRLTHIKFINSTLVKFQCVGYTNSLLSTKVKLLLGAQVGQTPSVGQAGISENESWVCMPVSDSGYTLYSLDTSRTQSQSGGLVVNIHPVK